MFKNFFRIFLLFGTVLLIISPVKSLHAGGFWRPFMCIMCEDEDVTPHGLKRRQNVIDDEDQRGQKPYYMERQLTDFERSRMKLPTLHACNLDPSKLCCDCALFPCLNNDWSDFVCERGDADVVRIMNIEMKRKDVPAWWRTNVDYRAETLNTSADRECEMPCILACLPIALLECVLCPVTCYATFRYEARHPIAAPYAPSLHTPLIPKSSEQDEPSLAGGSYNDDLDDRLRSQQALSKWAMENVKHSLLDPADRNYRAQILTESSITYKMTRAQAQKLVSDIQNGQIYGLRCQPKVWKE
ncbi:MAG: hypothetical protein JSS34_00855 [Proteobacteria bacterium]|nr:hypothetical protein [Pseudomonadota bacterium]